MNLCFVALTNIPFNKRGKYKPQWRTARKRIRVKLLNISENEENEHILKQILYACIEEIRKAKLGYEISVTYMYKENIQRW